MGFIAEIRSRKIEGQPLSSSKLVSLFSLPSKSGVAVDESNALTYTAVFACVRVISETIASLPLFLYRRKEKGKEKARENPLFNILHLQPNPEMTSFQFRETLQAHLLLWGNAYAEIEWDASGNVRGLWPIPPNRVKPKRDENKQLVYDISLPSGRSVTLSFVQVLHIRGLSPNGLVGYSPIALAREAIGLGLAAEEYAARFYSNDASPGGVLEHPGKLSDTAYKRLKKYWEKKYKGLSNAHRVAILEEGMKWHSITIPAKDAQFIENRKFQKREIASIFRVPPHLIGDLERATFSNIEQQGIEFVVHCIRPWAVRWEQELMVNLLLPSERDKYVIEFLLTGLMRGDIESRYKAYAIGRQWGWLSADDVRELENMNPIPNGRGDNYLIPLNMMPAPSSPSSSSSSSISKRSSDIRKRLISSFSPLFSDMVRRIIRREEADIMRFVKKNNDKNDVLNFLEEFYSEHNEYIVKTAAPAFLSFSKSSVDIASDEISGSKVNVERFVSEILNTWASEHIFYSRNYLKNFLDKLEEKDVVEKFQSVFDEWKEKRVEKIKNHLLVRINNAVSVYVWKENGVSWKRWVSQCENPFCKSLDGKVIHIDSVFHQKGEVLQMKGKQLKLWRDIYHPPLLKNCFCMVEPVLETSSVSIYKREEK